MCEPISQHAELTNPNAVKVVADVNGLALYFSRATIPWPREAFNNDPGAMPEGRCNRHIVFYAYCTAFLLLDGCTGNDVFWHEIDPAHIDRVRKGSRVRPVWSEERRGAIGDIRYFEVIDGPREG